MILDNFAYFFMKMYVVDQGDSEEQPQHRFFTLRKHAHAIYSDFSQSSVKMTIFI